MAQVNCPHCGNRAYVRSSEQVTISIRELYVDCNNPMCLSRDVMTISPKHNLQPPVSGDRSQKAIIANMINMLPAVDRKEVIEQVSLF